MADKPHIDEATILAMAAGVSNAAAIAVSSRLEIVTDDDANPVLDGDGEAIRTEVWSVSHTVGRVTTSFDLVRGKESPDKRTPMTEDEVRDEIKRQIGNVAREAVRSKMSETEVVAERKRAIAATAARQRAEAAQVEADRIAAMTADEIAAEVTLKEDGEHPFDAADQAHELVDLAALTGAITAEGAAAERERLDDWRDRTERRDAVRADDELDADTKEAALAAIRAEIGA